MPRSGNITCSGPIPSARVQYLLTYGLVAITGVEYFYRSQEFTVLLFLAACFVFLTQPVVAKLRPLWIVTAFFLIELAQAVYYDNFVLVSLVGLLVKLLTVYLIIQICSIRFIKYYIDTLYICALLALPIYFATYIPTIETFLIERVAGVFFKPLFSLGESLYEPNPNIIIYTFNPYARGAIMRNSGPFWEPGGFAVFLNLALILNLAYRKTLLNRQNIVFILSIVTTLSTAGYITLFIVLLGYVLTSSSISHSIKAFYIALLLVGSFVAYSDVAFLGHKIEDNIGLATEDNTSRFGSAYFDLLDIAKEPWIGYGRRSENRFGQLATSLDPSIHRNNGVTFLTVTYGIPAATAYFVMLFVFLWRYCKLVEYPPSFAIYAFAAILSAGFSQVIFDRPLLLAFVFLAERLRYVESATVHGQQRSRRLSLSKLKSRTESWELIAYGKPRRNHSNL